MAWKECDRMASRREFLELASVEGANVAELCRRFGVSRKTGFKLLGRFRSEGEAALADRSRRPRTLRSPTPPDVEGVVLALRDLHPTWGGRKLRARLLALGLLDVPAASTITEVLRRHDRLDPAESERRGPTTRFERERPNDLWQMDFKGDFGLTGGGRCHPLTVLDDHSRFSLCVRACPDVRTEGVRTALVDAFRRYGMPREMLCDNGSPFGAPHGRAEHTRLTAWLLRLDVRVLHGRPYHPQTQGKEERFHRTLKAEAIAGRRFDTQAEVQRTFDAWREIYNFERPHEALGSKPPASRYLVSERAFPESLPAIEYGPGDVVRKVNPAGQVCFRGGRFRVGEAFAGELVALRPTSTDGAFDVFYCFAKIGRIDLRTPASDD